ncbi:FkbM family methyltransferase [Methylobacterium sp. NEAU K]|uniref:FkbM family methyltransferase n=1 Tax=Methylobacterium sp. NEAU K TaxID=3064946 RepID=UPI002732DFAE|nr:FkbM family methyltransferase [Methylobacterium sp. NEAU K]MDP4006943.1 FkbM family methyltransferase [Methylobacterium sp. NEAU K]
MDVELLTVFNALINLRSNLHARPHIFSRELDFLSFATKMAPYSNSQLLQDIWVLFELKEKRNGYFVEFGACDGVSLSNTLLLEKTFSWQGAVAEPARAWHEALYRNRDCYISDKCVYKTDGVEVLFNEADIGELSGMTDFVGSDFHSGFRQDGSEYPVKTISLGKFLSEARAPKRIDYMSIDVEGSEFDVLQNFDFAQHDIALISIEHNFSESRERIYDLLTGLGYRRRFRQLSMFDDWYVRPDLLSPTV